MLAEEVNIKTDLEEECTKIDVLSAEIETCLNQIRELKDKKQCPNCFNEIDLDAKFCNHCGTKQEEEKAKEVEILETRNDQEQASEATSDTDESINETSIENKETETENNSEVVEIPEDNNIDNQN